MAHFGALWGPLGGILGRRGPIFYFFICLFFFWLLGVGVVMPWGRMIGNGRARAQAPLGSKLWHRAREPQNEWFPRRARVVDPEVLPEQSLAPARWPLSIPPEQAQT